MRFLYEDRTYEDWCLQMLKFNPKMHFEDRDIYGNTVITVALDAPEGSRAYGGFVRKGSFRNHSVNSWVRAEDVNS